MCLINESQAAYVRHNINTIGSPYHNYEIMDEPYLFVPCANLDYYAVKEILDWLLEDTNPGSMNDLWYFNNDILNYLDSSGDTAYHWMAYRSIIGGCSIKIDAIFRLLLINGVNPFIYELDNRDSTEFYDSTGTKLSAADQPAPETGLEACLPDLSLNTMKLLFIMYRNKCYFDHKQWGQKSFGSIIWHCNKQLYYETIYWSIQKMRDIIRRAQIETFLLKYIVWRPDSKFVNRLVNNFD